MTDSPKNISAYRYSAGDVQVIAVWEGYNPVPLKEGFVRNASAAELGQALTAQYLPGDVLRITFTPLVLKTGDEIALLDTGMGTKGPATTGQLQGNLAAAGIAPDQVTTVIISHFHGDHINGLRDASGELVYKNARIMVPAAEWDYWMGDDAFAQADEARQKVFQSVRGIFAGAEHRIETYGWDQEILPGITTIDARGHTPGHTAFMIGSGDDALLMISDVTNHPALFMHRPDWKAAFDMDPDQAEATRHRILDMAADKRLRIAGYHLPFPATGHVEKTATGYRFQPAQWS